MPLYDVHTYAVVRIKMVNVEAPNMKAAIVAAQEWNPDLVINHDFCHCTDTESVREDGRHVEHVEYADAIVGFLVDVVGDNEFLKTRAFTKSGKPAKGNRPPA